MEHSCPVFFVYFCNEKQKVYKKRPKLGLSRYVKKTPRQDWERGREKMAAAGKGQDVTSRQEVAPRHF